MNDEIDYYEVVGSEIAGKAVFNKSSTRTQILVSDVVRAIQDEYLTRKGIIDDRIGPAPSEEQLTELKRDFRSLLKIQREKDPRKREEEPNRFVDNLRREIHQQIDKKLPEHLAAIKVEEEAVDVASQQAKHNDALKSAFGQRDSAGMVAALEKGAEPLMPIDAEGNTLFHTAARRKMHDESHLFSSAVIYVRPDVFPQALKTQNHNGDTPLHVAAEEHNAEYIDTLLNVKTLKNKERVQAVNTQNVKGFTPAHSLVNSMKEGFTDSQRTTDVAKRLKKAGADFTLRDKDGETPTEAANIKLLLEDDVHGTLPKHANAIHEIFSSKQPPRKSAKEKSEKVDGQTAVSLTPSGENPDAAPVVSSSGNALQAPANLQGTAPKPPAAPSAGPSEELSPGTEGPKNPGPSGMHRAGMAAGIVMTGYQVANEGSQTVQALRKGDYHEAEEHFKSAGIALGMTAAGAVLPALTDRKNLEKAGETIKEAGKHIKIFAGLAKNIPGIDILVSSVMGVAEVGMLTNEAAHGHGNWKKVGAAAVADVGDVASGFSPIPGTATAVREVVSGVTGKIFGQENAADHSEAVQIGQGAYGLLHHEQPANALQSRHDVMLAAAKEAASGMTHHVQNDLNNNGHPNTAPHTAQPHHSNDDHLKQLVQAAAADIHNMKQKAQDGTAAHTHTPTVAPADKSRQVGA